MCWARGLARPTRPCRSRWRALARVALARGDIKRQAESLATRANDLAAHDPSRSTEPLRVLGAVYAAEERFDDGEAILRRAIDQDRRMHGENSVEEARSLAQLANLLLRARRFAEALAPIEQASAIDQSRLGSTHPLIADDLCDLGLIYGGLERDADASRVLLCRSRLLDKSPAKETPRVAYAELDLAGILRAMGDSDAADAAFADAKRILDKAEEDERQREREI